MEDMLYIFITEVGGRVAKSACQNTASRPTSTATSLEAQMLEVASSIEGLDVDATYVGNELGA